MDFNIRQLSLGFYAKRIACCLFGVLSLSALVLNAADPLVAQKPILVPNTKGNFDFLHVDEFRNRLLAAHTGNGSLDVFDLDAGKLIKSIPTGKAQGVAVDHNGGRYYVSVSAEQKVVVIDINSLEKVSEIKLPGDADDIFFNPKNRCVYVDFDHGTNIWVIDANSEKIIASVPIAETPEVMAYDPINNRLFQNVVADNSVYVVDPVANTVVSKWPLAPASGPHGLEIDSNTQRLFAAGNNGKLVVLDAKDGTRIASVDIAKGTDQIAFDPANLRLYCASAGGVISVLEETPVGATLLGNVKTVGTGKTLAVDPRTHAVWTAYYDKTNCYLLKLTP